jgi:F-type H+-transporting ATPase subunit delta
VKISKEIRQLSRELVRASHIGDVLDRNRVQSIIESIIKEKPRNYVQLLQTYQRLLRLELEKKHAVIESASGLEESVGREIVSTLEKKYGPGLTTEFMVNPALLGGLRVRIGSDVWDSSVRNRLERLQQQFLT